MIGIARLMKISDQTSTPIYLQIAQGIVHLIQEGKLSTGTRIQPTRDLSKQLRVNRNTVVAAYNELEAQGWITVKPRKGFYIADNLPLVTPRTLVLQQQAASTPYPAAPAFDTYYQPLPILKNQYPTVFSKYIFTEGFPDIRLAPIKALSREYNAIANSKTARKYLSYSSKEGSIALRLQLVEMLRQTRGLTVGVENIMITKGAQMGIYLSAFLLIKPGDNVVVGEPNYFLVNAMLQRLGAKLDSITVDKDGMDIDKLAELCKKKKVKLVYIIPHHHHPTTATLSPERRLQLLELASRYRFAIIEDDFDFDIHFENRPVLPMISADKTGSVIYIGTMSKVLAPAIRLGFIVAPRNFIQLLAQQRYLVDLQADSLLEESMARLFQNNSIERHLKKIRILYKERRDIFCHILKNNLKDAVSFEIPEGGLCVWVKFNKAATSLITQEALRNGVFIRDGTKYNSPTTNYNALCIGFASMNPDELNCAGKILTDAAISAAG